MDDDLAKLHEFLNTPVTNEPLDVKFKAETALHKKTKLAEIAETFDKHTTNSSRWNTMSRKLEPRVASS